jgi:osmotically-inducible protein OsmY
MRKHYTILAATALALTLNGCFAATVFTAAEAGKTLAQERSAGSRLDDNAIAIGIYDKFVQKDFNDLFANVDTQISEGRVLLSGNVTSPEHKVEAERLTWEVAGVKEVINEIQVNNSSDFATYIEDAYISRHIKTRMFLTEGIKSVNYGVQTVNGVVYLMGIAASKRELDIAVAIARRAPGVKKVVSHVIFNDDPRRGIYGEPVNGR